MQIILALALKDWRLFWTDGRAAVLCFVVPILLASAFGMLFDRPPVTTLPLAIICESDDPAVQAFVNDLLASPRLEACVMSRADAERAVADRRLGVAVIMPADFKLPKLLGVRPKLELVHHPLSSSECQWAEGVLTEVMVARLTHGIDAPFQVRSRPVSGASFNAYSHSFGGMTLQYLLFWGMESGLLLLRERQRGVWQRLRVAPVPLRSILLGKALATATLALLQLFTTLAFGHIVFGVGIESFGSFLVLAVAISTLAAATGLVVATLGGTEARARSVCILAILGMSMMGGLWLPSFLLPAWARDVAQALPTTWAMHGLDAVTWQGGSAWASVGIVLAFSTAFLAIASLRMMVAESRRRKGFGVA